MDRAVVYTTDPGFLVPSLVSACEVRDQVATLADIVVAVSGLEDEAATALGPIASALGLKLIALDDMTLGEGVHFNRTHVTPATLLRFRLGSVLDARYRHIVYLDGDTRITGDIRPLIRHTVAPGKILSANDSVWLGYHLRNRYHHDYLRGLGIRSASDYFNAGVLALRRETLDARFPEALAFFLANSTACRFHDQSALNATFLGQREILSPRYNFVSDYVPLDVFDDVAPAIVHFTGANKPWLHEGPPWYGRFSEAYRAMVARFPALAPYCRPADSARQEVFRAAHERRRRFYRVAFPIYLLRRRRVLRYVRNHRFSF